jgi:hypothetical protein
MLERIPLSYYFLSGLFNAVTSFALSIFVFSKNPKSRINQTFSLFAFTVAGWSLFYFLWLTVEKSYLAEFYLRTLMLFVVFIPSTFTHFILTFLKVDFDKRVNICNYLISLLLGFTVYTQLFARDIGPFLVFPYWLKPRIFFHLHSIHFLANIIYSHFLMLQSARHNSGVFRNQILYVFIGTAIGYSSGGINYLTWYRIPIPPFLNILVSAYVVMMAYAIVRYHLLDINIAVTRVSIFAFIYILVLGIPFWLGYKHNSWQIATWIMLFLATAGPFIFMYLRRRAEDILLREQRRYQRTLRDLSKTMTRIRDLNKLLKAITLTVADTVKVSFAAIYLKDEENKFYKLKYCYPLNMKLRIPVLIPFDSEFIHFFYNHKRPLLSEEIQALNLKFDPNLIVPCFIEDNLLGFLVLGPKSKNQMFTCDDVSVFETLSYSASLAIENCLFWENIRDRERRQRLREMDIYSYSLAHEIDNPVQIILGEAGFIKRELGDSLLEDEARRRDIEESFEFIFEAARRISKMVAAIKDFGREVTGEFGPLRIENVIDDFCRLIGPEIKNHGIIFSKNIAQDLRFIRGEKPELMTHAGVINLDQ